MSSIPQFYTTGSHYECGFNIGKQFEHRIKKYIQDFDDFKEFLLPFLNSDYGKELVYNFLSITNKKYPWYVDEMRGIAMGSNLPFEHILVLNFRVELLHVIKRKNSDCVIIDEKHIESLMECSDFSLNTDKDQFILHNEDASIAIYETGYFVTCKIISKDYNGVYSPEEEFTCYCYPGHLPGNAFAFNSSGFVFTVDALLPKAIALNRFPRQIVSRCMLAAKNLKELEDYILNTPIAYGFCLNLGFFGSDLSKLETDWNSEYINVDNHHKTKSQPIIWNYELAPNLKSNKTSFISKHCLVSENLKDEITNYCSVNYCYHFNHYERVEIEQCVVNSSRHRKKRANEMKTPECLQDLLNLAFDDKDEQYPIYRVKDNYSVQCIATALFDLKNKKLSIYNGRFSKVEPFMVISMRNYLNSFY